VIAAIEHSSQPDGQRAPRCGADLASQLHTTGGVDVLERQVSMGLEGGVSSQAFNALALHENGGVLRDVHLGDGGDLAAVSPAAGTRVDGSIDRDGAADRDEAVADV